jgi:hypothetical protein
MPMVIPKAIDTKMAAALVLKMFGRKKVANGKAMGQEMIRTMRADLFPDRGLPFAVEVCDSTGFLERRWVMRCTRRSNKTEIPEYNLGWIQKMLRILETLSTLMLSGQLGLQS